MSGPLKLHSAVRFPWPEDKQVKPFHYLCWRSKPVVRLYLRGIRSLPIHCHCSQKSQKHFSL